MAPPRVDCPRKAQPSPQTGRIWWLGCIVSAAFALFAPDASFAQEPAPQAALAQQVEQYRAEAPKTIIELQQFRATESSPILGVQGRKGRATLVNLNPRINAWFLLRLDWDDGGRAAYHLENPDPKGRGLHLSDVGSRGVRISFGDRHVDCALWSGGATTPLEDAQRSALPYAPLCDSQLFLRNRVPGNFTTLERTTEFLRENVWGSETIIGFVRRELYSDHFAEKGAPATASPQTATETPDPARPLPALLGPAKSDNPIVPADLGVGLALPMNSLAAGQWYQVSGLPGIYVSFLQPRAISPDILSGYRRTVNVLDSVESSALVYLVAFDLAQFDLGFAVGTDHPRVDWSDRPRTGGRRGLPGPDGIGTVAPVVTNGMISPALAARAVATFTGGYKRQHGAFKYGAFAERNKGSHYGFIEQGTVLSKLVPGLSTLYVLDDGTIGMKTWTVQDDALLPRIRFARQNGVPLIEYDPAAGVSAPGPLVNQWGPGNWSGSADEKLRSLRAGACLEETQSRRFLIYGYFSTATPSAMARVFQAYRCRYAMHLDMNALEHTYLALYAHKGSQLVVEHLVQGMAALDKKSDDGAVPRFLAYPDNRDFFYFTRKGAPR